MVNKPSLEGEQLKHLRILAAETDSEAVWNNA
jgi:hypothetical protein